MKGLCVVLMVCVGMGLSAGQEAVEEEKAAPASTQATTAPAGMVDPNEANSAYWNNLSGSACSFWTEQAQKDQYPDWNIRYKYCKAWNPNWGKATVYQDPRSVRLGFKLSW